MILAGDIKSCCFSEWMWSQCCNVYKTVVKDMYKIYVRMLLAGVENSVIIVNKCDCHIVIHVKYRLKTHVSIWEFYVNEKLRAVFFFNEWLWSHYNSNKQCLNFKKEINEILYLILEALISRSWCRVYTKLFAALLLLPDRRIPWKPESMMERLCHYRMMLLPANTKERFHSVILPAFLGGIENTNIFIY